MNDGLCLIRIETGGLFRLLARLIMLNEPHEG